VESARDRWADWLLERRHGGDDEALRRTLDRLAPVRDRVLDGAGPRAGDVVLDVGAGDGLIAFGALERVGPEGRVIFGDVSQDLLDHARTLAEHLGVAGQCAFVVAAAQDLAPIEDASVDAVTTRSTVIYVPRDEKPRAFAEFFRVLRPGGRLSSWEPINAFAYPEPEHLLWGIDVTEIQTLTRKLKQRLDAPRGDETLTDFDERDLLAWAEAAGFARVELAYEATVERGNTGWDAGGMAWETLIRTAPNPHAPTFEEVMDAALTEAERGELEAFLRPRFEARAGTGRWAVSHLRAVKA
jgi:ubiquinone/menaquinone biosynthesis C-methylase UbiE